MRARMARSTIAKWVGDKGGFAISPDGAMLSLLVPWAPIAHDTSKFFKRVREIDGAKGADHGGASSHVIFRTGPGCEGDFCVPW